MSSWPAYADLEFDGFGLERDSALERTETESGLPKQTRVKSRVMVSVDATVWLDSKADYLAFLAWHKTDLGYGAAWFDWAHPVTGAVTQARIVGGKLGKEMPADRALAKWKVPLTLEYWDA